MLALRQTPSRCDSVVRLHNAPQPPFPEAGPNNETANKGLLNAPEKTNIYTGTRIGDFAEARARGV